jgi:hypothetical protein
MKDAATLLALADKVCNSRRSDDETNALIRCALFAPGTAYVMQSPINGAWCIFDGETKAGRPRSWEPMGVSHLQRTGDFTGSVDAAMSLIPEGWMTAKAEQDHDGAEWHWTLQPLFAGHQSVWGQSSSASTALTAAALRAHAAIAGQG